MVTLKDLVAKEMSSEAKEVFMEALKKSCEEQAELMRKAESMSEKYTKESVDMIYNRCQTSEGGE